MSESLPSLETTRAWLARASDGDAVAVGQLLQAYNEPLLRRVRIMMGPKARECAETGDFVQETILDALRRLDSFELESTRGFLAWLATIARGKIASSIRKRHELLFTNFATSMIAGRSDRVSRPSEHAIRDEELHRLADVLEQLPEKRRRALELRYFDGLSFAEIGRRLDRSENAAQLLHARALSELGRLLAR
jgi:RNA polymerase sigma-70 factor (ECF subfamily)